MTREILPVIFKIHTSPILENQGLTVLKESVKITIWAKRYYLLCFDYQCSYQHSIRFVLVFCWPFFLKQMVKWYTTVSTTLLLFPEIHYYITELMQFFRQKMSQVLRYGNFQSFFIHKTLLHQNESTLLPQSAIFSALKKCM